MRHSQLLILFIYQTGPSCKGVTLDICLFNKDLGIYN